LWDASSGARVITLQSPQPVQALTFNHDGGTLLSRDQQSVLFWNLSTYQRDRAISLMSGNTPSSIDTPDAMATHQPLTLSPDGQTLAIPMILADTSRSSFVLDLRQVATGERLTVLSDVIDINFSPDNRFLVTLGEGVQVWQP
jgi:WD40 repeat protein